MLDEMAPIVVGVDGSAEALHAAQWAGGLAARLHAPLHIVTATPHLGHEFMDTAAAVRAAAIADRRDCAQRILTAAEDVVRADQPAVAVTTHSVTGPVDDALVTASRDARLLVLGCGDLTATGALLVGSTTLASLGHAKCPVVAWRGGSTASGAHAIVVGVDGSGRDGGALRTAFELADGLGTPLRVIHSWSVKRRAVHVGRPATVDQDVSSEARWRHLNELVDPWRERHPGVHVTLIGEDVKASHALILHATDAAFVVVGSRRRTVLTRGLLGSTSLNLLHHSSVPVVLCPFDDWD